MNKIYYTKYHAPFGELTLQSDGIQLTGVSFPNKEELSGENVLTTQLPVFEKTKEWLDQFFMGKNPSFCPEQN